MALTLRRSISQLSGGLLPVLMASLAWCGEKAPPGLGPWGPPATQVAPIVPPVRAESPKDGVSPRIAFIDQKDQGRLHVLIDGAEAFVYRYGTPNEMPFPCLYPIWSPSGKALTEQGNVFPWPHHESFWFINDVQLEGHEPSKLYYSLYNRRDSKDASSPFINRVEHLEFLPEKQLAPGVAQIGMKLLWRKDPNISLADQQQQIRVVALGSGEYLLDIEYRLTASYGKLTFVGDNIHYAWPMVRMQSGFSPDRGGKVANSEGGVTDLFPKFPLARWIDMSNTVGGVTEGLAMLSRQSPSPHKWFVRNYGTFGPRRMESQDGKPFTLAKGESIETRIGVLVHKGDAASGKVAERCADYLAENSASLLTRP